MSSETDYKTIAIIAILLLILVVFIAILIFIIKIYKKPKENQIDMAALLVPFQNTIQQMNTQFEQTVSALETRSNRSVTQLTNDNKLEREQLIAQLKEQLQEVKKISQVISESAAADKQNIETLAKAVESVNKAINNEFKNISSILGDINEVSDTSTEQKNSILELLRKSIEELKNIADEVRGGPKKSKIESASFHDKLKEGMDKLQLKSDNYIIEVQSNSAALSKATIRIQCFQSEHTEAIVPIVPCSYECHIAAKEMLTDLTSYEYTILTGSVQLGKTSFLRKLCKSYKKGVIVFALYIDVASFMADFKDPDYCAAIREIIKDFKRRVVELSKETNLQVIGHIQLDEIDKKTPNPATGKCDELLMYINDIKHLIDTNESEKESNQIPSNTHFRFTFCANNAPLFDRYSAKNSTNMDSNSLEESTFARCRTINFDRIRNSDDVKNICKTLISEDNIFSTKTKHYLLEEALKTHHDKIDEEFFPNDIYFSYNSVPETRPLQNNNGQLIRYTMQMFKNINKKKFEEGGIAERRIKAVLEEYFKEYKIEITNKVNVTQFFINELLYSCRQYGESLVHDKIILTFMKNCDRRTPDYSLSAPSAAEYLSRNEFVKLCTIISNALDCSTVNLRDLVS